MKIKIAKSVGEDWIKENLKEISNDKEAKKYKSLGRGVGVCLSHCYYLGYIHTKNFEKRVKAFRVWKHIKRVPKDKNLSPNQNELIDVEFFQM